MCWIPVSCIRLIHFLDLSGPARAPLQVEVLSSALGAASWAEPLPLTFLCRATAVQENQAHKYVRAIDLDVDIGADAVDYNAIAKQESLSGLEVEMRKLEGVVKEIVDELNYLKRREARMRDTNGELIDSFGSPPQVCFSPSTRAQRKD